jgi:hypothetical protein
VTHKTHPSGFRHPRRHSPGGRRALAQVAPPGEFVRGDAGIAAAAGLVLSAIAVGRVLTASLRRESRIPPFDS